MTKPAPPYPGANHSKVVEQKPANKTDEGAAARSEGDHVEVEVTPAQSHEFFVRHNFGVVDDFGFGIGHRFFESVAFFFGLRAYKTTEKTGVFVSVEPARAVGTVAQKVVWTQRLGFGDSAAFGVGDFKRQVAFVIKHRKGRSQIARAHEAVERKQRPAVRALHAARVGLDFAAAMTTMQFGG